MDQKEIATKDSSPLTVLLLEKRKNPKCFEINKRSLKIILLTPPTLFFLSLLALIILGYAHLKNLSSIKNIRQDMTLAFSEEKKNLKSKMAVLKNENLELLQKLKAPVTQNFQGGLKLFPQLFQPIRGQRDLRGKKLIIVEKITAQRDGQRLKVRFNIKNPVMGAKKLRGHIIILLQNSSGLYFYPSMSKQESSHSLLRYDDGENFTISLFRPVEAEFILPQEVQREGQNSFHRLSIYIFSRTGDLLYSHSEQNPSEQNNKASQ